MKYLIYCVIIMLGIQSCSRPSYGLRSVNYKRTQQYIKRVHGYKAYGKKEGFFKRLGQWPKEEICK